MEYDELQTANNLKERIEELFLEENRGFDEAARELFEEFKSLLNSGAVRAAERRVIGDS